MKVNRIISPNDFSPLAHSTPSSSDTLSSLTDTITLSSSDSDLRELGIPAGRSRSSKDSSAPKVSGSETAKEVIENRKCLMYFWVDTIYRLLYKLKFKTWWFPTCPLWKMWVEVSASCQIFLSLVCWHSSKLSPLLTNMTWFVFSWWLLSRFFLLLLFSLLYEQMVENALTRKPGGDEILEEYRAENSLSHRTRRQLVNILASDMIERHG